MDFLSNLRVFDTLLFFSQKDDCQEIFANCVLSGHVSFRAIGENLSVSSSKNTELGIKKIHVRWFHVKICLVFTHSWKIENFFYSF